MGYEIVYCAECQVQLRGRAFEQGEAFRLGIRAVCKSCAPMVIKSLPPDQVQVLLKQMVLAQSGAPQKDSRGTDVPPPAVERKSAEHRTGPKPPSLTPLWAGLALVLFLMLGLTAWVLSTGGRQEAPALADPGVPKDPADPARPAPPRPPARESAVQPPSPKAVDKPRESGERRPPDPAHLPPAKGPLMSKAPDAPRGPAVPGLVGHWKLDEGAGTAATDSSGNPHHGILVNGPAWVAGKLGTALSFNGGSAVLNVETRGSLANLHKSGLTVGAWIYSRGSRRANIVDTSNSNVGWILTLNLDSKLQFVGDQFRTSELILTSTKIIPLNSWRHVAATWDGGASASQAHLFIDGILADGSAKDGVGALRDDVSTPLSIGNRRRQDRGFDGLIDDVRIYNRVLSAVEILGIVQGTEK